MMTLKDCLLTVALAYAEARNLSHSRVSTIVFGDGKVIDRLQGSSDITTGRYEAAMDWFSLNWPNNVSWPDHVMRPASAPALSSLPQADRAAGSAPLAEPAVAEGC